MDLEACVEEGMELILPVMTKDRVTAPKAEQVEAMCSLLRGFDTTCCLPTGWGKSMIFFGMPAVYNFVTGRWMFILFPSKWPLAYYIIECQVLRSDTAKNRLLWSNGILSPQSTWVSWNYVCLSSAISQTVVWVNKNLKLETCKMTNNVVVIVVLILSTI